MSDILLHDKAFVYDVFGSCPWQEKRADAGYPFG